MQQMTRPRALQILFGTVGLVALVNVAGRLLPPLSLDRWVVVHTVLEATAVVVAFLIFAIGVSAEERVRGAPMRFLALAFLTVALLDSLHLLTYEGMPSLGPVNTWHRNLIFWLGARLVSAGALLVLAARRTWPAWRPRHAWISLGVSILAVTLVAWVGFAHAEQVPLLWDEGVGLTPLKIGIEWLVIAANVAAAVLLARRRDRFGSVDVNLLFVAVGLMAVSEVCFVAFALPGDLNNVLGHVVKTVAYLCLDQAVFVATVREPYRELVRSERALAESREMVEVAFAESATGKALVAPDGTFVRVNESLARILGLTPAQAEGRTWMSFTHPDDLPNDREALVALLDGRKNVHRREKRYLHADGHTVWVDVNVTPIHDADGAVRFMLTEVQDLSDRKRTEEELHRSVDALRQAQKMEAVGRLAGGIAHDFNNLLTAILSTSALLQDEFGADDPRRQDIAEIAAAAKRGAGLTRQLLAFSRQQTWTPEACDLGEVVEGFGPILQRVAGPGVRIVLERVTTALPVRADRSQIEQIVLNLVVNARDAVADGTGTVRVRTAAVTLGRPVQGVSSVIEPGSWATLEVSDDGIGIPGELQTKIFDPFFTTKPVGAGTGLGLATVYGIARQHGAHIQLESSTGLGTTFRLHFPLQLH